MSSLTASHSSCWPPTVGGESLYVLDAPGRFVRATLENPEDE